MGFKHVLSDNSIYIYSRNQVKLIVPIFIDNITLVSKDDAAMDSTVQELSKHFKLRDLGATTFLLSVQVKQDLEAHTISLSQSHSSLLSTAPSLSRKQVNSVLQIHHLWPESHFPTTDLDTGPGRMGGRKNSGLTTKAWKEQIPCQMERIYSRRRYMGT